MGYQRVFFNGVLVGIECVCTEPERAAQGTRHHRSSQLPIRAGPGIRLFQGKNQSAESRGNRAYLSGRRRVLLGIDKPVLFPTNSIKQVRALNENGDANRTYSYYPKNRYTGAK